LYYHYGIRYNQAGAKEAEKISLAGEVWYRTDTRRTPELKLTAPQKKRVGNYKSERSRTKTELEDDRHTPAVEPERNGPLIDQPPFFDPASRIWGDSCTPATSTLPFLAYVSMVIDVERSDNTTKGSGISGAFAIGILPMKDD